MIPMSIRVYLLLNSLPPSPPWYAGILQELRHLTRFQLTVINNGQPYAPKRLFHQLGLTCQLLTFPLRFHPAQLIHHILQTPPKEEHILWLEDRLLWHPSALPDWLKALDDWAWISPNLLPADAKAFSLKIFQEQAQMHSLPERRLQLASSAFFPPCLLIRKEALDTLFDWVRPDGQLPLLQLAACDSSSPAWHPGPATAPNKEDFALTIPEAIERWDKTWLQEITPLRQRVLLESLQKALPDSPQVYARLIPLLPLEEAFDILKQAFKRGLDYPELLGLLQQALKASGQETAAAFCQEQLSIRFPAFKPQLPAWSSLVETPPELHWPAHLLSQKSSLSVCLIVKDEAQHLPRCLASVKAVASEIIVIDTGSSDHSPSIARNYGAQVYRYTWNHDFAAARNEALKYASCHWILVLDADEYLDEAGQRLLANFLWQPPIGMPRFQLKLLNYNDQGDVDFVHFMPRLFPRHPLFSYEGRIHEQLIYSGPGRSPIVDFPGLEIHHLGYREQDLQAKNKRQRNLDLLQELQQSHPEQPEWAYYIADCYLSMGAYSNALSWYEQAIVLWDNGPQSPISIRARVESLRCLQALNQQSEALEAALNWKQACQHNPDYWYLRGQLHRSQHDYPAALQAFETCLLFGSQQAIEGFYNPNHLEALPLLQMVQIYRGLMNHPRQPLKERQYAVQQLLRYLEQSLQVYIQGQWQADEINLYVLLAEAAIMGARLQLPRSALQLFRQYAPQNYSLYNEAYYAETALMLLAKQTDSLLERLPPEVSYEQLRELQQPHALHQFCEQIWHRPEIDGANLAAALLHIVAIGYQDASLLLLLSRLLYQGGARKQALRVLRDARLYFADHLYLLHYYAQLLLEDGSKEQALHLMKQALQIQPDFVPAQQLLARLLQTAPPNPI